MAPEIPDEAAYAHLLGLYLGDGCIWRAPRTVQLQVSFDARHPRLAGECRRSMAAVAPDARISVRTRRDAGCLVVSSYWHGWSDLFPQHGLGPKHRRKIDLADWQEGIVSRHGWPFLRGLLESDGCRSVNRVRVTNAAGAAVQYRYPRWFFVNASPDIRALFCRTCDRLGVGWTRSRERMISISRRESVALLDERIGSKR
jgi:hypothetical protein